MIGYRGKGRADESFPQAILPQEASAALERCHTETG